MKLNKELSVVDLFCGIGGLSKGLKSAGLNIKAGIDLDETCSFAFENNIKAEFIADNISEISGCTFKDNYWGNDIKVLVGCAPCQPFSSHSNKNKKKQASEKWNLLNEFFRIVKESNPDIVSMENVPNLSNQIIFEDFISNLENLGYYVSYQNVYCPNYGIPQKRRRLVLLASKAGYIDLIEKTHSKENYKTVKKAIGNLKPIKNGEIDIDDPFHKVPKMSNKNLDRIKASKPNGSWKDWNEDLLLECHKKESGSTYTSVYGRMSWNEPSPTITTQFYNYGTGRFGHPTQDRALSLREGALLQTFPKNYNFFPKNSDVSIKTLGRHIGNAVPVKLGYVIGLSIKEHINKNQNYYEQLHI